MNRVLILYSQGIIGAGMASAMGRASRAEVISSVYVNRSILNQDFDRFHPDVVIIDEQLDRSEPTLICDLLNSKPCVRVIVAAIEENVAYVYERHSVNIHSSSDVVVAAEKPIEAGVL